MSLASVGNMLASIFRPKSSFSLSSLLPFGSLIDSGIGLISGISNNIYDRQLQQTIFERDDTQLTRLMKEYQRNGLNPLLGLPGASVGNTKGFEPSQISSNFSNAYSQKLQLDSLKLQNKNMDIQNDIARQELKEKKMSNALERTLMKAKVNANRTHFKDYFDSDKYRNLFDDGTIVGVDFSGQSEKERLIRFVLTQLGLISNDGKDSNDNPVNPREENLIKLRKMSENGNGKIKKSWRGTEYLEYPIGDSTFDIYVQNDGRFNVSSKNTPIGGITFNSLVDALNYCQDEAQSFN